MKCAEGTARGLLQVTAKHPEVIWDVARVKTIRHSPGAIRKRAAMKGDVVVAVKPGEEVVSVNVGWTVEKFVEEVKERGGEGCAREGIKAREDKSKR
jgi:hypothetical protein